MGRILPVAAEAEGRPAPSGRAEWPVDPARLQLGPSATGSVVTRSPALAGPCWVRLAAYLRHLPHAITTAPVLERSGAIWPDGRCRPHDSQSMVRLPGPSMLASASARPSDPPRALCA